MGIATLGVAPWPGWWGGSLPLSLDCGLQPVAQLPGQHVSLPPERAGRTLMSSVWLQVRAHPQCRRGREQRAGLPGLLTLSAYQPPGGPTDSGAVPAVRAPLGVVVGM